MMSPPGHEDFFVVITKGTRCRDNHAASQLGLLCNVITLERRQMRGIIVTQWNTGLVCSGTNIIDPCNSLPMISANTMYHTVDTLAQCWVSVDQR